MSKSVAFLPATTSISSSEEPHAGAAVVLRNVRVEYKGKIPILRGLKHTNTVLENCSMTVSKKQLFSLLGAQGAGKTTLLKTLVGLKSFSRGEIWVLGGTPGSRYNQTAGPDVGYMPQELALFGELSILETLTFFGNIYGMDSEVWLKRTKKYFEILKLPNLNRPVKFLSGGQKRRLSFIIAINHKPQLVVLDEPCVGVDPLVRRIMCDLLKKLVAAGRTVMMTTQYIEEAADSTEVAFLYRGRIIAQDSPANFKTKYNTLTITDVYFKITDDSGTNGVPEPEAVDEEKFKEIAPLEYVKTPIVRKVCPQCSPGIMRAMLFKNSIRYIRNWKFIAFLLIMPIIQVAIFNLTMPNHSPISMGVVNRELQDGSERFRMSPSHCPIDDDCISTTSKLSKSCTYLSFLKKNTIDFEYYPDEKSAEIALSKSEIYGTLKFEQGFTRSLKQFTMRTASPEDFKQCQIYVSLDMSSPAEALVLKSAVSSAYQNFTEKLASECGQTRDTVQTPIVYLRAIYGQLSYARGNDFVAAGSLCAIVLFLSVSVTSLTLLEDKKEGLQQRTYVAGVNFFEMLLSHTLIQIVIVFVQANLVVLVNFGLFGNHCEGYYTLFIIMLILQGMVGGTLGYFLSAVCSEEDTAIELTLGLLFPIILLSGIFWSSESIQNPILRFISQGSPMTWAVEAGRKMIIHGWTLTSWEVSRGILTSFLWIIVFWILALIFSIFNFE